MTRVKASALLLLLWAAIYLPGLGSTEIKGEEGRRILPAVTMLDTGHWLVPYVGGEPFLRKPPLVNWAIAASFKLTGVRNAWTARMPSALCVLALGLVIVATSGPGWIGVETAFAAAVMATTSFGLLAKARFAGAEIEGVYAPLSGMAVVCWLAWRSRGCSPWLFWAVPGILLGLAALAKGPSLHFVFYYAIVIAVLWNATHGAHSRLRAFAAHFFQPAHFAGLALAVGIFAAWAVPYFRTPEAKNAAAVWKRQGIDRFTESEFNARNYFLNLPRGLMDQLPWLLLAPAAIGAVRRRQQGGQSVGGAADAAADTNSTGDAGDGAALPSITRPLGIATAACFLIVLLVPGTLPRYVLPLGAPIALVLAMACTGNERLFGAWLSASRFLAGLVLVCAILAPFAAGYPLAKGVRFDLAAAIRAALAASIACACCALVLARSSERLTLAWLAGATGALLGSVMLLYGAAAPRWIARSDDLRPFARAIDGAIPAGGQLVIFDPGYLAAIFYLRTPYRYSHEIDEISTGTEWVLIREKHRRKFAEKRPKFAVVQTIRSRNGETFLLLQRGGEPKKLPAREAARRLFGAGVAAR